MNYLGRKVGRDYVFDVSIFNDEMFYIFSLHGFPHFGDKHAFIFGSLSSSFTLIYSLVWIISKINI